MANCYERLGMLALKEGDGQTASVFYEYLLKITITIVTMEPIDVNVRVLALVSQKWGEVLNGIGKKEEARSAYGYALTVLDAIEKENWNARDYKIMEDCNRFLAK